MNSKPIRNITASEIANFLRAEMSGVDFPVKTVATLDDPHENALIFSKNKVESFYFANKNHICLLTPALIENTGTNALIIVDNPRLAFAKTLAGFFVEKITPGIGNHSVIDPSARIGKTVFIGNGCTIGRNVEIGEHTEIRHNVVIAEDVKIGRHCLIRSNVVIGEEGFSFEFETNGIPIRIPHIGSVEIGNYVEVGNFTAIARGTLNNTIIDSHVKIDNLVHIAHNCVIGENSMIIACAEISGSTTVGKNCWLGVGCATMQKIKLGDNCLVGVGSVVLKDVPSNAVMAGNPAKLIRMKTDSNLTV